MRTRWPALLLAAFVGLCGQRANASYAPIDTNLEFTSPRIETQAAAAEPAMLDGPMYQLAELYPLGQADDGEHIELAVFVEPETHTRVLCIVKSPLGLEVQVFQYTDPRTGLPNFTLADTYDVRYLGFERAVVGGQIIPRSPSPGLDIPVGDSPLAALQGESIRMRMGDRVANGVNAFAGFGPAFFMIGASSLPGVGEGLDVATLFGEKSSGLERWISAGSLALTAVTLGLSPNFGVPARTVDDLAFVRRNSFDEFDDLVGAGARYRTTPMDAAFAGEHYYGRVWSGSRVRYLDDAGRAAHRLVVRDGKLHDMTGNLFDTAAARSAFGGRGNAIFVMDDTGQIFASTKHSVGRFHHSSFLAGRPVAAAGEIVVDNGMIRSITRRSGHYQPGEEFMEQFLRELRGRGTDLNGVRVGSGF